jgi:hypothetical protein
MLNHNPDNPTTLISSDPRPRRVFFPAQLAPCDRIGPLAPYDAILLLSFGGPEKPDDVMPSCAS